MHHERDATGLTSRDVCSVNPLLSTHSSVTLFFLFSSPCCNVAFLPDVEGSRIFERHSSSETNFWDESSRKDPTWTWFVQKISNSIVASWNFLKKRAIKCLTRFDVYFTDKARVRIFFFEFYQFLFELQFFFFPFVWHITGDIPKPNTHACRTGNGKFAYTWFYRYDILSILITRFFCNKILSPHP